VAKTWDAAGDAVVASPAKSKGAATAGTPRPSLMVAAPKAGEAPIQPIDVWANQTQKRASLLGLDSPLFGATTIAFCTTTDVLGQSPADESARTGNVC